MNLLEVPTGVAAELLRRGAADAGRLADRTVLEALAAESSDDAVHAETIELVAYQLRTEGQAMRSPMRFATSAGGGSLAELHEHPDVERLVAELAGRPMASSKAAYLFFDSDRDFIGLHTDVPACELTLLVGIDGAAPHLVVYPELQGAAPEELLELAERTAGAPPGGAPYVLGAGQIVALVGGRVPHQTPAAARPRRGTVASLCYVGSGSPL